jgi:hypothetical protein
MKTLFIPDPTTFGTSREPLECGCGFGPCICPSIPPPKHGICPSCGWDEPATGPCPSCRAVTCAACHDYHAEGECVAKEAA